jgi:hypothetical protein
MYTGVLFAVTVSGYHNASGEADVSSASEQTRHIPRHQNVDGHVFKSLSLASVLSYVGESS